MPEQQNRSQPVMLADNFPAKAFLLITHLTDTDPSVSSFSTDGTAFEIYDQAVFAQKYLPQYFKHSNYGSFVRQLNLYGFTSSRLKQNNDIVVWSHDSFHRDRKDLVKEIKRSKKAKNASPSQSTIVVNRALSPRSLSSAEEHSSVENAKMPPRTSSLGPDQSWFESEFAFLKKQNESLEQKLDLLLNTLQISPPHLEEAHLMGKRRRVTPYASSRNALSTVDCNRRIHNEYAGVGENFEEHKSYDGKDQSAESSSFNWERKAPLGAMVPQNKGLESRDRDESLKRFVDIMLNEDDQECHRELDQHSLASSHRQSRCDQDSLGNELMEEAINTMITSEDLFAQDAEVPAPVSDPFTTTPPTNHYHNETMANAATDKPDGPQLIRSITPDIPTAQTGDIEEGGVPIGVAVVAAQAELIEEDVGGNNAADDQLHPTVREHLKQEKKHRGRLVFLLAMIGSVLVAGVTTLAVVATHSKRKAKKLKARFGSEGSGSSSSADHSRPLVFHHPPPVGRPSRPSHLLGPGSSHSHGAHPCPNGFRGDRHGRCRPTTSVDNWQSYPRDEDETEANQGIYSTSSEGNHWGSSSRDYLKDERAKSRNSDAEDGAQLQNNTSQVTMSHRIRRHGWNGSGSRSERTETSSVFDQSPLDDAYNTATAAITSFSIVLEGSHFACSPENLHN
jgi:hypothetical protein